MYSKLICAGVLVAGAAVQGHSIETRDVSFASVNRDGSGHSHGGGGGGHGHGSSGGSAHGSSGGAGGGGYGAPPASSYSAPSSNSYSAPAPSYGAPSPSYSAPSQSYGSEPSYSSHGTSSYGGYDDGGKLDLTTILIPLLALLGLSLLFPTYVSLTVNSGRKRRSAEGGDEGE